MKFRKNPKRMWRDRLRELAVIYGSGVAVQKRNAAADELRALIREIGSTDEIDELLSLLDDPKLGAWIAYGVLQQCPTTSTQRKLCVNVIRSISRGDGPDALAAQSWLSENGEEETP